MSGSAFFDNVSFVRVSFRSRPLPSVADLLQKVAENFNNIPWGQGDGTPLYSKLPTGHECVTTAIGQYATGLEFGSSMVNLVHRAYAAFATYLEREGQLPPQTVGPENPGVRIIQWNDAPGRTKMQVMSALFSCAAIERAKEATSIVNFETYFPTAKELGPAEFVP